MGMKEIASAIGKVRIGINAAWCWGRLNPSLPLARIGNVLQRDNSDFLHEFQNVIGVAATVS
jgi:hypothetical protein